MNQVKLDLAIGKLMGLKTNWPVATTDESHSRFEVASDKYQKKVQISSYASLNRNYDFATRVVVKGVQSVGFHQFPPPSDHFGSLSRGGGKLVVPV